ncbi:MAG: glycosyltransferase family 4 protein [Thermodesulfovibrionia bacterium]|nr:glycosyltransferase family 4 protein [Thermodesulfovibrionia bacterium]
MKRILIVSTSIPASVSAMEPVHVGGAELVAWKVATGLLSRFEVHVLTTGERRLDENKHGMMIHYVPHHRPLALYYSTLGKKYIDEIFSRYNFDLISIHLVMPWGYILRNYPGKKVLTDMGMRFYVEKRNLLSVQWDKYKTRAAFNKASAITTVSRKFGEVIKRDFGVRTQYIPIAVDLERFSVDNSNERSNIILFMGRYVELKGIRYLLEAAKQLPMYEFWFTGKGPMEGLIQGDNVKNLGYVEKPEDMVKQATICIFPSLVEYAPLVGLEAMASGKAVIATNTGFLEYMEHAKDGFIIETGSVDAIVNAINYLMGNKELRSMMGSNARKKAEQYSWDIICKQYAELFQKVIDGGNFIK